MTFEEIHQKAVIEGEALPIGEIEGCLRAFASIRKLEFSTIAILLADSQKRIPGAEWRDWSMETTGLTRSECYHRAKVGKLLIACREKKVLYRKLLQLSGDKLLALSRLPLNVLESFLSVTDVWNLKIDEVRRLVACELCRIDSSARGVSPDCEHCPLRAARDRRDMENLQMLLPGFDQALDAIWQLDEETAQRVRDAFSHLSAIQQKRLLMVAKGMSLHEIAAAEGSAYSSVKESVDAARKKFLKYFAKCSNLYFFKPLCI